MGHHLGRGTEDSCTVNNSYDVIASRQHHQRGSSASHAKCHCLSTSSVASRDSQRHRQPEARTPVTMRVTATCPKPEGRLRVAPPRRPEKCTSVAHCCPPHAVLQLRRGNHVNRWCSYCPLSMHKLAPLNHIRREWSDRKR